MNVATRATLHMQRFMYQDRLGPAGEPLIATTGSTSVTQPGAAASENVSEGWWLRLVDIISC